MCLDLLLELGVVCWLHLDLAAIAVMSAASISAMLTRQKQMNLELCSVVWSRWLTTVHSMSYFAFPVEPRTFPVALELHSGTDRDFRFSPGLRHL